MRSSEDPTKSSPARKKARDKALTRLVSLLKGMESVAANATGTVYGRYQTQIKQYTNARTIKANE